jgi:hypothetical protein
VNLCIIGPDRLNDLEPLFKFFQQLRDDFRRVLQIAIHQDGSVPIAMIQTCNQRHLVPEATGQVQDRDPCVPGGNVLEHGERIVTAPVEHIDDTKRVTLRQRGHDTGERRVKNRQPFFLIVNG